MAERSRVTNISSGTLPLPAIYGGKLIAPGSSEVIADTNANVIAALGGARAVAGAMRVEFVPDSVPATVAALEFGVPQSYVDDGDAATLASAQGYADAAAAAAQAAGEAYTDAAIGALPGSVIRYAVPIGWYRSNIAQGLTEDNLFSKPGGLGYVWRAPRGGSIVGISANIAGSVTAGSLTLKVGKPGFAALELVCTPGQHSDGGSVIQAAGIDTYLAGAQVYMVITTSADYDDSAGRIYVEAWVQVEEAVAET